MNKPKCKLIGTDDNIFALVGKASRALKDASLKEKAIELQEKIFNCQSYDEALKILDDYVDIEQLTKNGGVMTERYIEISGLRIYFEPNGMIVRFEIKNCDDILTTARLNKTEIAEMGAFLNSIQLKEELPF